MSKLLQMQSDIMNSGVKLLGKLSDEFLGKEIIDSTKKQIHIGLQNFMPRIYATQTQQLRNNFFKAIDYILADALYLTETEYKSLCEQTDIPQDMVKHFALRYRHEIKKSIDSIFLNQN